MKNSREIAAEAYIAVLVQGAFSNVVLDRLLQASELESRDKAFASALFYGAVERKITLAYAVSRYMRQPAEKTDPAVLAALHLAVYQILFMDSVPESAAVNEAVAYVKKIGKGHAAGFVNAVLRSFLRDGGKIIYPDRAADILTYFSVYYSLPQELIKLLLAQYPGEDPDSLLAGLTQKAPVFARVNTQKTTPAALCETLAQDGVQAGVYEKFAGCLQLEETGRLEENKAFYSGLFHIQDIASQVCAAALGAGPGMRVLDACSAPGGKAFTIAERMHDDGEVLAWDLSQKKIAQIQDGADRLGLSCVRPHKNDAAVYDPKWGQFDRVLCDVPCSGYGIIRKKPEIRYKPLAQSQTLPEVQYKILQTASKYLKAGGKLLYSTCTLSKKENEEVVSRFINENADFAPENLPEEVCRFLGVPGGSSATFLPHIHGSDGFFVALFTKVLG